MAKLEFMPKFGHRLLMGNSFSSVHTPHLHTIPYSSKGLHVSDSLIPLTSKQCT